MWVYMKGVKNINLVQIIEFLYNGEVLIEQEGIKEFLNTAKDLQMKGLKDERTDETLNLPTNMKDEKHVMIQEVPSDTLEERPEFLESLTDMIIKVDENNVLLEDDAIQ